MVHINLLNFCNAQLLQAMIYMSGAKVGFFGGNIKKLMDDVKELRPTMLIAVPRILYRLYDKVNIYNLSVCSNY